MGGRPSHPIFREWVKGEIRRMSPPSGSQLGLESRLWTRGAARRARPREIAVAITHALRAKVGCGSERSRALRCFPSNLEDPVGHARSDRLVSQTSVTGTSD